MTTSDVRRRALLIGSFPPATDDAPESALPDDVPRMRATLARLGFSITECLGREATRRRIFLTATRFLEQTREHDAVVFYYAGHGGLLLNPNYDPNSVDGPTSMRRQQYFAPADFFTSKRAIRPVILRAQLSSFVARLSSVTKNVVVVIDCCHAQGLARGKFITRGTNSGTNSDLYLAYEQYLRSLEKSGGIENVASNNEVIRIYACGENESAFAFATPEKRIGVLTDVLTQLLDGLADEPITWSELAAPLRRRIDRTQSEQHPQVVGPQDRVLFSLDERPNDTIDLFFQDDVPLLRGGGLAGLSPGDILSVRITEGADRGQEVGQATVLEVKPGISTVELESTIDLRALRRRALGAVLAQPVRKRAVRIEPFAGDDEVREALAASLAQASEGNEPVVAIIRMTASGSLAVCDATGSQLVIRDRSPAGLARIVKDVDAIVHACCLRELAQRWQDPELGAAFDLDLGQMLGEKQQPKWLADSGANLTSGDRICVSLRNLSDEELFITIFAIGPDTRIQQLDEASNLRLAKKERRVVPAGEQGLLGYTIRRDGDTTNPNMSLVCIVTNVRMDQSLQQGPGLRVGPTSSSPPPLDRIARRGLRGLAGEAQRLRAAVRLIHFAVH